MSTSNHLNSFEILLILDQIYIEKHIFDETVDYHYSDINK